MTKNRKNDNGSLEQVVGFAEPFFGDVLFWMVCYISVQFYFLSLFISHLPFILCVVWQVLAPVSLVNNSVNYYLLFTWDFWYISSWHLLPMPIAWSCASFLSFVVKYTESSLSKYSTTSFQSLVNGLNSFDLLICFSSLQTGIPKTFDVLLSKLTWREV